MASHPDSTNLKHYQNRLEEFLSTRFGDELLPSHDINHHIRVWKNAQIILEELQGAGYSFTPGFQIQVLIACMTHDIGMAIDTGENHGSESREICLRFLNENNIPHHLHTDILFAVENHDDKSYTETFPPDSLFTVLSVADDMDAFGYTGIYRYIEIYLARNKPENELADLIVSNATVRLKHLMHVYKFLPDFCRSQQERFRILSDFFDTSEKKFPDTLSNIYNVIIKSLSAKKTTIETALIGSENHHHETALFFKNLLDEMQN
ncbi:MAG: HD domain-containing protein [Bacteroidales bacterium]